MGSPLVTPKVEGLNISDIVKMLFDKAYNLAIVTADDGTYTVGECLEPGVRDVKPLAVAANVDGVCMENVVCAGSTGVLVALVRGPAIVDGDLMEYNAQAKATVDAALLVLGILVKDNVTA